MCFVSLFFVFFLYFCVFLRGFCLFFVCVFYLDSFNLQKKRNKKKIKYTVKKKKNFALETKKIEGQCQMKLRQLAYRNLHVCIFFVFFLYFLTSVPEHFFTDFASCFTSLHT